MRHARDFARASPRRSAAGLRAGLPGGWRATMSASERVRLAMDLAWRMVEVYKPASQ